MRLSSSTHLAALAIGFALALPGTGRAQQPSATVALALAPGQEDSTAPAGDAELPWHWRKKNLGLGFAPAIAVDVQGHSHIVFAAVASKNVEAIQDLEVDLVHTWTDGKAWFTETIVSDVGGYTLADLAIDDAGALHVAFGSDWDDLGLGGMLHYATNAQGAWTTEEIEPGGEVPQIAIDTEGNVHIAHRTHPGALRYVEGTAGDWDTAMVGVCPYSQISLLLDGATSYILFSPEYPELDCATRTDGTWSTELIGPGERGSLAVDDEGTLHAFFESGTGLNGIAHAWRTPSGWESEALMDDDSLFGQPLKMGPFWTWWGNRPLAVRDFAGRLQLVFNVSATIAGGDGGSTAYVDVVATWDDGTWVVHELMPVNRWAEDLAISRAGVLHTASMRFINFVASQLSTITLRGTRLTMTVSPSGAGTITDGLTGQSTDSKLREAIQPGTELSLTAAPAPGFVFVGWAKDASGDDATCTLVLDKPRKVVARFEPEP